MKTSPGLRLTAFLELLRICQGLQCHICNYAMNSSQDIYTSNDACQTAPLPDDFLGDCSELYPTTINASFLCMKTYVAENSDRLNIKRYCAIQQVELEPLEANECRTLELGWNVEAQECNCDSDGCNGSSHLSPSFDYFGFISLSSLLTLISSVTF